MRREGESPSTYSTNLFVYSNANIIISGETAVSPFCFFALPIEFLEQLSFFCFPYCNCKVGNDIKNNLDYYFFLEIIEIVLLLVFPGNFL